MQTKSYIVRAEKRRNSGWKNARWVGMGLRVAAVDIEHTAYQPRELRAEGDPWGMNIVGENGWSVNWWCCREKL